jgi:ribosomal protein L22
MYTFKPGKKFAKASGQNMRISTKSAELICRVIRKKPLTRAKRLLSDLAEEKRSLDGMYYSKTVREMLMLLESCEKNAEFLGLDSDRLFVHASAHTGTNFRRRRRKAGFGSKMKSTNLEIMLIERGRAQEKVSKERPAKKTEAEAQIEKEVSDNKKSIDSLKKRSEEMKELAHAASEKEDEKK